MFTPSRILIAFITLYVIPDVFAEPQPTLLSAAEIRARRETIYAELDQNTNAVKQCFELLDSTDTADAEARQFLDDQIRQFDDRSNVLHDELEEMERFEYLVDRQRELVQQVARLRDHGNQLKQNGHPIPARLKLAQAGAIQRTLDDGTWRMMADDKRCPAPEQADPVSVLALSIEVTNLKEETAQLRAEVKLLGESVQRLEHALGTRANRQ